MQDHSATDKWVSAYISATLDPDLHETPNHPEWWAIEKAFFCAGETSGEDLWLFILAVLDKDPPPKVIEVLAAGPLEELIAYAGRDFIDRIEQESRRSPAFRDLLAGVWQHGTPEDIWARVVAVRGDAW